QADYTMVIPFLVKALLDNRKRYEARLADVGEEKLFTEEPRARGYLRPPEGYRLFEHREPLRARLLEDVRANAVWLRESIDYSVPAV
ncbi:MAG: hypothetical protein ACRD4P_01205, partial [Bryobacteraceae bacterium]